MSNAYDLTFESGTLPSGVALVKGGTSAGTFESGGLIPSSTKYYNVAQTSGNDVYLNCTVATLTGSDQLSFGVGGFFRVNSIAATGSNMVRFITTFSGTGGAQIGPFICYNATGGVFQTYVLGSFVTLPSSINLADGNVHSFFIGVFYSATSGAGQYALYIDNVAIYGGKYDNSTLPFGNGTHSVYLGPYQGATGSTCSIDFDGIYFVDSIVPSTSIEQSSVISGYTTAIPATQNTLQLSSTLGGSAVWALRDTQAFSINSSGLITLNQSAGGMFDAGDGDNWVSGEFLKRVLTWTPTALSGSGPYTSSLSFSSSDGITSYTDALPSATPYTGYAWPTGNTGTAGANSFTLTLPSLVSGIWQGLIVGKFYTLSSSAATPLTVSISPSAPTVAGGATQTFTPNVTGVSVPSQAGTWSAVLGSFASNVYTAPAATGSIQTDTITFISALDGVTSGTTSVTIPTSTVTSVTVSPSTATVSGGGTQTFTAVVNGTGSPSQSVTWTAVLGSITSGGVYTAPAATSMSQSDTVTATSVQDGTKFGTATVTVPATATGNYNANVNYNANLNYNTLLPPIPGGGTGISGLPGVSGRSGISGLPGVSGISGVG